jgi:ACS family hexuronate transporter-like MFS transporter
MDPVVRKQICAAMEAPLKSSQRFSSRTFWICILLFAATAIIYLDRQVMALTAEKIIAEFRLNQQQWGKVLATFRYSYGIVQLVGGFLVDAHGPAIVFPAASGLWALGGFLTGLATSVAMLAGCRFLLGIGEAFNWPSALKVTNSLLSPEERPLANGIFNSGAAVGALVAPLLVTLITVYFSWRAAFVATGTLGGVWVIVWRIYTRGSAAQLKGSPTALHDVLPAVLHILRLPEFWMLAVTGITINSVNYYLADWIPLYLKTTRGFSFAAGNILSIIVYAGISCGNILVGLFVRSAVAKGLSVSAAKRWALLISCVLMGSAAGAGLTPSRYLAVILLALTGMGTGAFLVIYLTLAQDLAPRHVGISSGLLGGMGNLVYGFLSPYVGMLADLHRNSLTLSLIGALPWLAFFAIFWAIPREIP